MHALPVPWHEVADDSAVTIRVLVGTRAQRFFVPDVLVVLDVFFLLNGFCNAAASLSLRSIGARAVAGVSTSLVV
jgi:hypothetical protein